MNKQWRVTGWDSTTKIYEAFYPFSAFSKNQMKTLLERFVCRDLSFDVIADCTRRQKRKEHSPLIEVSIDTSVRFTMSAGTNPHYTAMVEEGEK